MESYFLRYLKEKGNVKDEHLQMLNETVMRKTFKKWQLLLSKGQICQHFFFVETGLVRFYSIDDEGKEHIVQFAPEGWFTSDRSSIFFNEPSEFFIDAVEDSTVVMLDNRFLSLASEISPEFRNYNEFILQNHIRQLQNRINLLIGADSEKRYLDFVEQYPDLMLRVPLWMIASYLGITPESLSRVRKELALRNFKPR
jgi:CRP/FNR family transcriptional regulator, anaerobic regulatory protein